MWWAPLLNNIVPIFSTDGGTPAPSASYNSIASATGTGSSGSITFSSIPSTYSHLQVRYYYKTSATAALYLRMNSDSGSNYSNHEIVADTSTATSTGSASQTQGRLGASNGKSDYQPCAGIVDLHDYANTSKYKTFSDFSGNQIQFAGSDLDIRSGMWMNTSAINSLTIYLSSGNFTTDTVIGLYGIVGTV